MESIRAAGLEALALFTDLLRRVRLADATAGVWEAADVQWWWRRPRASDALEQAFWVDGSGPLAAVLLTEWDGAWRCDPLVVPDRVETLLPEVWNHALGSMNALGLEDVVVIACDDDEPMLSLLADSGFVASGEAAGDTSSEAWMPAAARSEVSPLPHGYRLLDRSLSPDRQHWLARRNGPEVEDRLRQCSMYDPDLDLAIQSEDGEIAAYGLFWNDPVTNVGLVEPMRTEDAHQRRGLARAVLTNGLHRLAARGAERLKVGYATAEARDLYTGVGFRPGAMARAFARRRWSPFTRE